MDNNRKPFQGVVNIIRFNWHFYVIAMVFIVLLYLAGMNFNKAIRYFANILIGLILFSTFLSLIVSTYIYDLSGLYKFSWLDQLKQKQHQTIINIHAGFDETSGLLQNKFKGSVLSIFDFYDPLKHTEVSIRRARKAYAAYPHTQVIKTFDLPIQANSTDKIFLILSAHEIRNQEERTCFFKELYNSLDPQGQIIVTEHLRDSANFFAYNIGFLHFHSKQTWLKTFQAAGLNVAKEIKITAFITTFILEKNGISY